MGNAIVRTLSIAGNAVTVPAAQTLTNRIGGNGAFQNANSINYTLPFAATVVVTWFGSQGYLVLSNQALGIRLRVNGNTIWSRVTGDPQGSAGLMTDWLSMGWSLNLGAGSHLIQVDWWGGDSNVGVASRTLLVQGAMR
ncbi:hypothetical protein Shpa_20 [Paracoccus phage Shpa]|uniref:Uncharacterized protein n=1 Tax=Paracoccus phage Shpa TaxID=1647282 RepID=A0A0U2BXQ3_9CAUD|nr:hypothetical protein FDG85_gp20 [Paracoccus phage Shpa]AKG94531.1 hypothetical protein Shpa_20 [Paracoccus phage Shpa]